MPHPFVWFGADPFYANPGAGKIPVRPAIDARVGAS
jgi:hypothetical protein